MKRHLPVVFLAATVLAHSAPASIGSVSLPGPVRWDYVSVDPRGQHVYVAHSDRVEVIDARSRKPVLQLAPTPGVHGAAPAPELGRIFTSDGGADDVGVFDMQTGRRIRTIKVGQHPDAIVYDAATRRVFAFNGRSNDVTAIDANTLQVLAASIPASGSPEYAVSDGMAAPPPDLNFEIGSGGKPIEPTDWDVRRNTVASSWGIGRSSEPRCGCCANRS